MIGWQAMRDAPRDGRTTILLSVSDGEFGKKSGPAVWAPFYLSWVPGFELESDDPRPLGWAYFRKLSGVNFCLEEV